MNNTKQIQPNPTYVPYPSSSVSSLRSVDRERTEASVAELGLDDAPQIDAHAEDAYWAEHFNKREYVADGTRYDEVRAAYRFGWDSRRRMPDATWQIALPKLRAEWNADPANFMMSWPEAESATRDAWNHAGLQRSH